MRLVAPPPAEATEQNTVPLSTTDPPPASVLAHPAGSARRVPAANRVSRADRQRLLLVGDGAVDVQRRPDRTVVGHLSNQERDPVVIDLRVGATRLATLGTIDDTLDVARATEAGTVVLSAADLGPNRTAELVHALSRDGRRVEVVTGVHGVGNHRLQARRSQSGAVLTVAPVSRFTWREPVKRMIDVVLSSMLLLLCAPLLGMAALAIRVSDGPGVLFRQVRIGRDGQMFTVLKFRTMVCDAEQQLDKLMRHNEAAGPMFKMRDDPRVTKVGRILRGTSIDELPQLVNVLRGDMSLVGPRPALPREVAQWDERLLERLRVRPGITGPWQVHGRFTASLDDYERLDVGYVDNWTLLGDLRLLLLTVPAVLGGDGAA